MEKLLERISAYDLLGNLIPGAVLYALLCRHVGHSLIDNVLVEIAVCYFLGLVAGRIGSLLIEPLLEKLKLVKKRDYSEFVAASRKDPKIETLSGVRNMYRSFIAVLAIYAVLLVIGWLLETFPATGPCVKIMGVILLILLFFFSYRKQTGYVNDRIKEQLDGENQREGGKA